MFFFPFFKSDSVTFPTGTKALFFCHYRGSVKLKNAFFSCLTARVQPCRAICFQTQVATVPGDLDMSSSEAAINHVWLQKRKKCSQVACSGLHTTAKNMCTCFLYLISYRRALRDTTSVVWWEKSFGSCKTPHHVCNPSSRNHTDYSSQSWAPPAILWRNEKKKSIKWIVLQEPTFIWRGAKLVPLLKFHLQQKKLLSALNFLAFLLNTLDFKDIFNRRCDVFCLCEFKET